ncbi:MULTISPECIES: TRAP transporter permease [Oceanobacillus]|uniref:TRAP transporter permease n=1 Tax=Oceanobacillus profundus TaxID=372463 RepID=A0A417YDK1_9BACI|nr:TRAP transporter permease [Oceanobacillus profundus]MBR3117918.1 TRAP transporter permease [Oceanobacillus sp.]MCM3397345.1 TRAP transporter permease [Oceanobacillus profundus]PAE28894.1 C4-dicarboxylate ABC transporter [Paenibacillus sp. 7884-2]RHW30688.1 TRAP transporter permease [Oceanobacillus profundus]
MKENSQLDAKQILEKYDRESNYRVNIGKWAWVVSFLGVALTLFHLYTGYFGTLPSQQQGAIHLGTALGLMFLLFPAKKGLQKKQKTVPWYDVLLAFTAIYVTYHKIIFFESILQSRISGYGTLDVIISILGILLLLEATRRTVGLPIVIVASVAILYAVFGNFMPTQILSHPGFAVDRITTDLWYKEIGIFGTPIQISAKFIFLFLFFGVILVHTKIGQFFNDIALALTGRFTGGTAKTAVVASALQGMVSGSSVGNTVASGSFTIPMMKKSGFKPEFAAATEASASTGGQIMPPIMGAAAFIMMEYLGVSYGTIMLAAIVPAVLYFTGIFIGTHFEAKKIGVIGLPKAQLPVFKELMVKNGYMLLPLFIIIGTIMVGFTPQRAALMGIFTAFLVSLIRKDTRMSVKKVFLVLEEGARVALPVIAAVGTAGIIAGVVSITGLGAKFAASIIALSGGILFFSLIFTMIACIILGMGLPTTANYVVTATIAAPVLINDFGVLPIAAHMFVFYFGIVADITPPVCLAAYAGAGIARANPFKSGVTAVKLAIAAFIIPYIFIYNPILLLQDITPIRLIISLLTAIIGMTAVSSAVIGFFIRSSYSWERLILFIAGVMLIVPDLVISLIGLLLLLGVWYIQKQRKDDSGEMKARLSV